MSQDRVDQWTERAQHIHAGGMVPGLMFQMTAKQMRDHLGQRAAHHERRAGEKQKEIPELTKALDALRVSIDKVKGFAATQEAPVGLTNYTKGNASYGFDGSQQVAALEQQINALQSDVKDHRAKSAMFTFLVDCVFDQTYMLTWQELSQIEAVK